MAKSDPWRGLNALPSKATTNKLGIPDRKLLQSASPAATILRSIAYLSVFSVFHEAIREASCIGSGGTTQSPRGRSVAFVIEDTRRGQSFWNFSKAWERAPVPNNILVIFFFSGQKYSKIRLLAKPLKLKHVRSRAGGNTNAQKSTPNRASLMCRRISMYVPLQPTRQRVKNNGLRQQR